MKTLHYYGIIYCISIFSSSITRYVFELDQAKYDRIFSVTGLTEIGLTAYNHSLEFAREEKQLTPEQKQARLIALDNLFNEGD